MFFRYTNSLKSSEQLLRSELQCIPKMSNFKYLECTILQMWAASSSHFFGPICRLCKEGWPDQHQRRRQAHFLERLCHEGRSGRHSYWCFQTFHSFHQVASCAQKHRPHLHPDCQPISSSLHLCHHRKGRWSWSSPVKQELLSDPDPDSTFKTSKVKDILYHLLILPLCIIDCMTEA